MSDHEPHGRSGPRLSYKFQRVREQLRQAVLSGEWPDKLPGERELAIRFDVNAKTLGKALTDLAAEGLLERTVGRGTFVRGAKPASIGSPRQLLVLHDAHAATPTLGPLTHLANAKIQPLDGQPLRPSFLQSFDRAVVVGIPADHEAIRGLVTRGVKVAMIDPPASPYSAHAARSDGFHAVTDAARHLARRGHRKVYYFGADPELREAADVALRQLDPDAAVVDGSGQLDCDAIVASGATALLLENAGEFTNLSQRLLDRDCNIPESLSVLGVGVIDGEPPCSGVYVQAKSLVQSALRLLADDHSGRPATVWHAGKWEDGPRVTLGGPRAS